MKRAIFFDKSKIALKIYTENEIYMQYKQISDAKLYAYYVSNHENANFNCLKKYSPNLSYQQFGTCMRPSSLCVQQEAAETNLDRKSNEDDS